MVDDWIETTLGDVLTLQRGFDLPINQRIPGTIPVVASNGIVGNHDKAKVKSPGVVIGRSGSIGGAQFIKTDFWALNTTLYVKDFKGNDPRFIYYLLLNIDFKKFNVGSGVPTLNRNHIHPLRISIPPLPEQKAIASILSSLDDKIELNQQMNRTLEAQARAIFKSWFVDFDPVRAKMEGRQPAGMDAATAALFPDAFEESELGVIPRGWRIGKIGQEFDITMGQSPPGSTYNEEKNGISFYQGTRDFGFRYPTERIYCSAPTRLASLGDTLVSVRAPVGDINMANQQCCIGRGVAAIRHKQGSRSYTYYSRSVE
ncbi:MAG: hypothetical protein RLZZ135_1066 [Cyanobacteriota bacterium]|jgi:type I restriction enzyme S subunit